MSVTTELTQTTIMTMTMTITLTIRIVITCTKDRISRKRNSQEIEKLMSTLMILSCQKRKAYTTGFLTQLVYKETNNSQNNKN